MTKDDIIRMAREAGLDPDLWNHTDAFERLAHSAYAAGASAEREKVAAWMIQRSYATGHGDTTEDLLKELNWQIRESEREACARECWEFYSIEGIAQKCNAAIRARGQQ